MADITGTNNNDILSFDGAIEHLTMTLVNPYSGETIFIDDDYNVNQSSYEGLAGIDSLFMTNIGDAIFLTDTNGAQMLFNIERIIAGDGGDVIVVADDTIVLGDLFIDGGRADDIIWGNAGNDTIRGFDGNDIIDGGPGNDNIQGQNHDDVLSGGDGNDTLNGGNGRDILRGNAGDDILQFTTDIVLGSGVFAQDQGSPGIAGTGDIKSATGTNGTFDVFDGGAGYDTLTMTTGHDTLFLFDDNHDFNPGASGLRLIDVEQINAGGGNDIIDLTSTLHTYGDIKVYGEAGNDTLWTSAGNDLLDGGTGDDNLHGGAGNDTLYGGTGNDILVGGPNAASGALQITQIAHEFNNTVLFPNVTEMVSILDLVPPGDNALGIAAGDLSVDYQTTGEVTFVKTVAGFDNTLGFYNISQDGTIMSVDLAFPNVKNFNAGDTATINLPGNPDTDFGFFIIANGANKNNDFSNYDLENGTLQFVYNHNKSGERLATIFDNAKDIELVYTYGSVEKMIVGKNQTYHTTTRGGDVNLNADCKVHVVSGLITDGDATKLRIGFEDLPNLGDADYNDVVFDIAVAGRTEEVLVIDDHDILYGGAGNDIIDGGVGDDVLFGGTGADTLYGGHGSDQFVFDVMDGFSDIVKDFEAGPGGDVLNVTDILQGYDALTDAIADFVQIVDNGADSELRVNADGDAGGLFSLVAIIEGAAGTTLADMINNGNLAVDQAPVL